MPRAFRRYVAVGLVGFLFIADNACSDSAERRAARIAEWERRPTPESVDRIRRAVEDPDGDVRARAVRALFVVGAPDAVEVASRALGDASGPVREAGALVAGEARAASAAAALEQLLRADPDPGVRRTAAKALGAVSGDDAEAALASALDDPAARVRLASARALAMLHPAAAVDVLARRITEEPDWEVRVEVAKALGAAGVPSSYPPLRSALVDPNEFVRAAVAAALKDLGAAGVPESAGVPATLVYGPGLPNSLAPAGGSRE